MTIEETSWKDTWVGQKAVSFCEIVFVSSGVSAVALGIIKALPHMKKEEVVATKPFEVAEGEKPPVVKPIISPIVSQGALWTIGAIALGILVTLPVAYSMWKGRGIDHSMEFPNFDSLPTRDPLLWKLTILDCFHFPLLPVTPEKLLLAAPSRSPFSPLQQMGLDQVIGLSKLTLEQRVLALLNFRCTSYDLSFDKILPYAFPRNPSMIHAMMGLVEISLSGDPRFARGKIQSLLQCGFRKNVSHALISRVISALKQ